MACKILLIDDEPDLLALVSHGLKRKGYEVYGGRDGREALVMAPQLMPDLIILDVGLPVINGDEVALIFKNDEKLKHIPIILISTVHVGLIEKTKKCGAEAYLPKPFELAELLAMVKKYCGQAQPPHTP